MRNISKNGNTFHNFGAAAIKALSPRVNNVKKLGGHKRNLLFDLKLWDDFVLKVISSVK